MRLSRQHIAWLAIAAVAAVMGACASIGHPEGGPRDEVPPVFLGSKPTPGALNVTRPRLELMFDENIKVDNPMDRVVVSPAQRTPASVIASGKKLIVELRDTLLPNTTYTVDFSDAIRDLNEGNILDGFATDFSTGATRDTLQISGMVLAARDLEPAQGMTVGVYSNLADSAISTLKLERIAKTNQLGHFTIRNLKPGDYRIFAVNDKNRDYHWDRSEDVAFYDLTIAPQASRGTAVDTLIDIKGGDSIVSRQVTRFTPNDILLAWFNENYASLYLKDHSRKEANRLHILLSAPADSLPSLRIINGANAGRDAREWSLLETRPARDSLVYWITDPAVIAQDSLLVETRYRHHDKLDSLTWQTDTLKFFFRAPKAKKEKKKGSETDSVPPIEFLPIKAATGATQELNLPVTIEVKEPVKEFDEGGIKLEMLRDTTWVTLPPPKLQRDSISLLRYHLPYKWEGGTKYKLTVDSAAMTGLYGQWNRAFKHEFTVKGEEEYANLFFKVNTHGLEPVVVELLSSADKVVASAPVVNGVATFHYVLPQTYYARCFIDANANGQWDTGNLNAKIQPEEVYYYPQKVGVRKNWDIEQTWDIFALPLDTQKPLDIKKNKPATKEATSKNPADDEEDDTWGDDYNKSGSSGKGSNSLRRPSGVRHNNSNTLAR